MHGLRYWAFPPVSLGVFGPDQCAVAFVGSISEITGVLLVLLMDCQPFAPGLIRLPLWNCALPVMVQPPRIPLRRALPLAKNGSRYVNAMFNKCGWSMFT